MIKAVVFDLDGTLLNTIQDLADASNYALSKLGLPGHTVEDYKQFVGDGRRNLILRMLPEEGRDEPSVRRATELFDEYYGAHLHDNTGPYPGIAQLLAGLKAKGLRLGVVSNKPDEFTKQAVQDYFPGVFDFVAGQQGTLVKPDPAALLRVISELGLQPYEVLYVGDSAVDINTAKNGKTQGCGVLWGFRGEEELAQAGARYFAAAPADIETLVTTLNHTEKVRRGFATFTLVLMLACLIGLFYFLFTGNGAGIGACVVLQLLLGFSSVQMLKKKEA